MALAAATLRRSAAQALRGGPPGLGGAVGTGGWWSAGRGFASTVSVGSNIVEAAPGVSLQKARTWDEGVSSKFSTTPLKDIFKDKKVIVFGLPGAYTGVCSMQHVPSYKKNTDKFKAKGVDSVICVAVNDPYVMNAWAEKLQAKDEIEFYGDFDGSFHKSLDLGLDLSAALLGHRSQRHTSHEATICSDSKDRRAWKSHMCAPFDRSDKKGYPVGTKICRTIKVVSLCRGWQG